MGSLCLYLYAGLGRRYCYAPAIDSGNVAAGGQSVDGSAFLYITWLITRLVAMFTVRSDLLSTFDNWSFAASVRDRVSTRGRLAFGGLRRFGDDSFDFVATTVFVIYYYYYYYYCYKKI